MLLSLPPQLLQWCWCCRWCATATSVAMLCATTIDATFMAAADTTDVLPLPLLQCYTATATDAAGMLLIPLCYRHLCCNIIPPPYLMLLACYCRMLPLTLLLWSTTTDNTAVAMIIPPPSHRCHSCCDITNQWCQGRGGKGEWDVCGWILWKSWKRLQKQ